jgi:hypothetical protein
MAQSWSDLYTTHLSDEDVKGAKTILRVVQAPDYENMFTGEQVEGSRWVDIRLQFGDLNTRQGVLLKYEEFLKLVDAMKRDDECTLTSTKGRQVELKRSAGDVCGNMKSYKWIITITCKRNDGQRVRRIRLGFDAEERIFQVMGDVKKALE